MASPPTSSLRFYDPAGKPLAAPPEWAPCFIALPDSLPDWERGRVLRNDVPLPLSLRVLPGQHEPAFVAEWPRSNPGRYCIWVQGNTGEMLSCVVEVLPRKLSREAYAHMLLDLETRLPASVALGLQRLGALSGLRLLPPGDMTRAQELTRLRRAVVGTESRPGLASILGAVSHDPHHILRGVDRWVSREQARRPHPARLAHALMRGQNLGVGGELLHVVDTAAEHTYDVYENRLLAAYAMEVRRRLARLIRLRPSGQSDDHADTANDLLQTLDRALGQASFLREVSRPSVLPARLTMVLQRRPPYRAALEGYLEFHRSPFVYLEGPALSAPLENVPRLYQVWGTLEIVDTVLRLAVDLGYRVVAHSLMRRQPHELYLQILPNGASSLRLVHPSTGVQVDVIPERTYGSGSDLHSISFSQRPDVAVEIRSPGQPTRIYVFDPKYKLDSESIEGITSSRPVKMDLDKMHAYRDAIRDENGERPVQYLAILYPGDPERYPDAPAPAEVEALHADPGNREPLEDRLEEVLRTAL